MDEATDRFQVTTVNGSLIGHYETKDQAFTAAIPGDSLFDSMAGPGEIELWLITGTLDSKTLMAIRRKR